MNKKINKNKNTDGSVCNICGWKKTVNSILFKKKTIYVLSVRK